MTDGACSLFLLYHSERSEESSIWFLYYSPLGQTTSGIEGWILLAKDGVFLFILVETLDYASKYFGFD